MKIDFGVYDAGISGDGPRRFCASFTLIFGVTSNADAVKTIVRNFQLFVIAAAKMIDPGFHTHFETFEFSDAMVRMFSELGRYTLQIFMLSSAQANKVHASVCQITENLQGFGKIRGHNTAPK